MNVPFVPSVSSPVCVPEKNKNPVFFGNESNTHFSKPDKPSKNDSISFFVPSNGNPLMILSNATLTFTSAELKKVWFLKSDQSTFNC